ncbi:DUF4293 domain-containing protein [Limibacter armeniacum]|uniref:DUF4293 domain-containing protein n=1 Tax=Limibacter armeniacum TaxID=466084 RepID=UPI002FE5FDDC
MIQRVQSIFLALVAICMIAAIFMPTWLKGTVEGDEFMVVALMDATNLTIFNNGEKVGSTSTYYIAIISGLAAIIAFASLFSFKNRMTQVKFNLLNTLLIGGVMMINIYFYYYYPETQEALKTKWGVGFFLPFAALLFNNLANRFIKKDEQLVKSVDRLR